MPLGYFRIRRLIPPALKTTPAANPLEARRRVLSLYRLCIRQAAEIQAVYPLDVPVYQIRRRMRQEFERHRFVKNLDTINVLLFKGTAELEETLYMWKTANHVMRYFKDVEQLETEARTSGWLNGFLAGRSTTPN